MTKGKTIRRPASEAKALTSGATAAEARPKQERGKLLEVGGGSATTSDARSPAERVTDTSIPEAVRAVKSDAPRPTKSALLRAMLAAPGGASLPALMAATGWQAHTLRAALSGLRKAGHDVTRHRAGEATVYAIGPDGPEGACTGVTWGDTAEGEVDAALAATPVRASE